MTNVELLAELNAFRAAEGKAAFADWRPARHMPMLETYRAAKQDDNFEATTEELAAQQVRPRTETYRGYELVWKNEAWDIYSAEGITHSGIPTLEEAKEQIDHDETPIVEPVKPVKPAKVAKEEAPKGKSYKEAARYEKSAIESPVKFVHSFLDANPDLSRKDAVIALTEQHGVNYSTARTQYQKWFSARKAAKAND